MTDLASYLNNPSAADRFCILAKKNLLIMCTINTGKSFNDLCRNTIFEPASTSTIRCFKCKGIYELKYMKGTLPIIKLTSITI
jgi:hypothetical protein